VMLQETASYGLFPAPAHIPKEVPIHSPFAIMPEHLLCHVNSEDYHH
jgi:hypothetical protein